MADPVKSQLLHMFITLFFMVGLIFLLAYLYKRFGLGLSTSNKDLKVVSTLALGTKEKLLIVQVGAQQLLLGVTAQNITTLHELSTPIEFSSEQTQTRRDFKKILEGLKK